MNGTVLKNFRGQYPEYGNRTDSEIIAALKAKMPEFSGLADDEVVRRVEGEMPAPRAPMAIAHRPRPEGEGGPVDWKAVPGGALRGLPTGLARWAASLPATGGQLMRMATEPLEDMPSQAEQLTLEQSTIGRTYLKLRSGLTNIFEKTEIDDQIAAKGRQIEQSNREWVSQHFARGATKEQRFFEDLGSGAGSLAAAVGIAILTKNPALSAVAFGGIQAGEIYSEAIQKGKSPTAAFGYGAIAGVAEAALEKIGLDFIGKRFGGRIASFAIKAASEGLQEFSQSLAGAGVEAMGNFQDRNVMEILRDAAYEGLMGSILGGGTSMLLDRHADDLKKQGIDEKKARELLTRIYKNAKEEAGKITKSISPIDLEKLAKKQSEADVQQYIQWWNQAVKGRPETEFKAEEALYRSQLAPTDEEGREWGSIAEQQMAAREKEYRQSPMGRENLLRQLQRGEPPRAAEKGFAERELQKSMPFMRGIQDAFKSEQARKEQDKENKALMTAGGQERKERPARQKEAAIKDMKKSARLMKVIQGRAEQAQFEKLIEDYQVLTEAEIAGDKTTKAPAEEPIVTPEEIKAPIEEAPVSGTNQQIGVNRDNKPIYVDDKGVRYLDMGHGVRSFEAVDMIPGQGAQVPSLAERYKRGGEYLTTEELNKYEGREERPAPEKTEKPPEGGSVLIASRRFAKAIQNKELKNVKDINRIAEEVWEGPRSSGKWTMQNAYNAMEAGMNLYIKQRWGDKWNIENKRMVLNDIIDDLADRVPTQTIRTAEKEDLQQFSTPPPLAYIATVALDPQVHDILLEPSAGTGNLLPFANNVVDQVYANEIDPDRLKLLETQQYKTTNVDAEIIDDVLPDNIQPTAIIMNPPFSATGGRTGQVKKTAYGLSHVDQALRRLQDGGRLVTILGESGSFQRGPAYIKEWYNNLASKYTVQAAIDIPGKVFQKFGTTFGTTLVVIDKTGPSKNGMTDAVRGSVETLQEALDVVKSIPGRSVVVSDAGAKTGRGAGRVSRPGPSGSEGVRKPVRPSPGVTGGQRGTETTGPTYGEGTEPGSTTEKPGPVGKGGVSSGRPASGIIKEGYGEGNKSVTKSRADEIREKLKAKLGVSKTARPETGTMESGAFDPELAMMGMEMAVYHIEAGNRSFADYANAMIEDIGQEVRPYLRMFYESARNFPGFDTTGMSTVEEIKQYLEHPQTPKIIPEPEPRPAPTKEEIKHEGEEQERQDEETAGKFVDYEPSEYKGHGGTHPGHIVESSAMSAIKTPPVDYTPNMEGMKEGQLSKLQMEAIALAGQMHEVKTKSGHRLGFFLGDGTGVGKGRQIAGVILDNWNNGRRRSLWLSHSTELKDDAMRDFDGIFGGKNTTIPIHFLNDKSVAESKGDVKIGDGCMFCTYSTFINQDRYNQLVKWLGEEGVVVFDESHKGKNAVPTGRGKPSKTGVKMVGLQNDHKDLRIVYSSATGATDIRNMGYMTRLGLWGEGTPFPVFADFAQQVAAGGLGSMEIVARDTKALGRYLARTLSYKGVYYKEEKHELTENQIANFDRAATVWRAIINNFDNAVKVVGGKTLGNERAQLWNTHQRFFKQMLMAFKIPTIIDMVEKERRKGNSIIIGLIGTGEAATERAVQKAQAEEGDLEGLDMTPRDVLQLFLDKSFPTTLLQEVASPGGEGTVLEPVMGPDGRPVQSKEALRLKKELEDLISDLDLPHNPLDQIINYFEDKADKTGDDTWRVAELTGRNKVIKVNDITGKKEYVRRAPAKISDKNLVSWEMENFQSGRKKIAVISEKASTGISLHADNNSKNQEKRIFITLEMSWSADKQMQSFGRAHRTNQRVEPEYNILTTNLGGEARFSSTIAKRLGSLGALTRGQKGTAGGDVLDKYDFANEYGSAALRAMYQSILKGTEVLGLEGETVSTLTEMGIVGQDPKTGRLVIPEALMGKVETFLNRVLGLPITKQNAMFNHYVDIFNMVVTEAKESGMFDDGVVDLHGEDVKFVSEQDIATDDLTKAKTKYVKLENDVKTNPITLDKAIKMLNRPGNQFALHLHQTSGHWAIATKSVSKTDPETGNITPMYRIYRYNGSYDTMSEGQLMDHWNLVLEPNEKHYRIVTKEGKGLEINKDRGKIENLKKRQSEAYYLPVETRTKYSQATIEEFTPQREFEKWWSEKVKEYPATKKENVHLITGVILPFWRRITANTEGKKTRIIRANVTTGDRKSERFVGIRVNPTDAHKILKSFGIGTEIKSGDDIYSSAMFGDVVQVQGVGGQTWEIRSKTIPGTYEKGVVLIGPESAQRDQLAKMGFMPEKVSGKWNYFLPTEQNEAAEILDEFLKSFPIKEQEKKKSRFAGSEEGSQPESMSAGYVREKTAQATPATPVNPIDIRRNYSAPQLVRKGTGTGKRMSTNELIKTVKDIFPHITIRPKALDRWKKGVLGKYFLTHKFVKTRNEMDVASIAHEVAHEWQERVFGILRKRESGFPQAIRQELEDLDYDQSRQPLSLAEGFAEFVRLWATDQNVGAIAPATTVWFETDFLPQNDAYDMFKRLRETLVEYRNQGSVEFVKAQAGFSRPRGNIQKFHQWLKVFRDTPGTEKVSNLALWYKQIGEKHWDDAAVIEFMLKKFMGKNYYTLKSKQSPVPLYRAFKMSAGMTADEMFWNGVHDIRNPRRVISRGPGQILRDVVQAGHSIEDFVAWLYARHARTWYNLPAPMAERLKRMLLSGDDVKIEAAKAEIRKFKPKNAGITSEQARIAYEELKKPGFDEWGDEITKYFDGLMQLVGREGGVDPELQARLRERYPYYIPLLREMMTDYNYSGIARRGLGNQRHPLYKAKGSDKSLMYYAEAWIKQTERLALWAQKAAILNSLTDLTAFEGTMPLVKHTSMPVEAKNISTQTIVNMLWKMGVIEDIDNVNFDEADPFMTFFFPQIFYHGPHPVIAVWKNGKRQWYELDQKVFEWVQSVKAEPMSGLLKVISPFARGVRLGATGVNPTFIFYRNFFRDSMEAAVMSESGKNVPLATGTRGILSELLRGKDKGGAFKEALRKIGYDEKWADMYLRSGGVVSTMAGFDRATLAKAATLAESKIEGKTLTFGLKHPIDGLRLVFSALENANRIPEYKKVYEKVLKQTDGDEMEAHIRAINAAKDVTTNFSRSGTYGRQLNQIIPFYNAGIQGFNKMIRAFGMEKEITGYEEKTRTYKGGQTQTVMAPVYSRKYAPKRIGKALGWVTALSMLTYFMRKPEEWEKLTDWERYSYFHFWIGDHHIRVVTPFTIGAVFHGATQAMMADAEGDSLAKYEYMKYLWDNHLADLLPTPDKIAVFGPLLQLGRNKSWSGRDIEPRFARETKQAKDITREWTLETSKFIMNTKPLEYTGVSPIQFEYFLNSITGRLYERSVGGVENIIKTIMGKNVRIKPSGPWDLPVVGNMFARPSIMNTKWTERYYAHYHDMKQRSTSPNPHPYENLLKQAYSDIMKIRRSKVSDEMQDERVVKIMEETVRFIESGRPDVGPKATTKKKKAIGV